MLFRIILAVPYLADKDVKKIIRVDEKMKNTTIASKGNNMCLKLPKLIDAYIKAQNGCDADTALALVNS